MQNKSRWILLPLCFAMTVFGVSDSVFAQRVMFRQRSQQRMQPQSQRQSQQQSLQRTAPSVPEQARPSRTVQPRQEKAPMTSGKALLAILDPRSKNLKDATGNHLMRRISLLNVIPESKNLQMAFVIDGTDSMGLELDSVKEVLLGIVARATEQQSSQREISFSLVVYRDTGAEKWGGETLVPSTAFTTDYETFRETVGKVAPVSGIPYFNESVDLGLYRAIDELQWQLDETTERWIILIGDAPPFPEGMPEINGARRSYATETLLDLAREKEIKINPILCSSGFKDVNTPQQKQLRNTYEKLLPETRAFFNTVYKGTNGVTFVDLSEEQVAKTLEQCLEGPESLAIAKITPSEVKERRSQWEILNGHSLIRVAVLTSQPLDDRIAEVYIPVCEMLKTFPLVELVDMETTLQFVSTKDVNPKSVDADWSVMIDREETRLILSLVSSDDPSSALEESYSGKLTVETVPQLLESLLKKLVADNPDIGLAKSYQKSRNQLDVWSIWSHDVRVCRMISQAMLQLEMALFYANDGEQPQDVRSSLSAAERYLMAALGLEPDNPTIHSLLANCYYNQMNSSELVDFENMEVGLTSNDDALLFSLVTKHANLAYDNRNKCKNTQLQKEIEGDYFLFTGQFDEAIEAYQALIASYPEHGNRDFVLRAHWALAGIYAGDWGAHAFQLAERSRDHVISLLSIAPDSQQGRYFVKTLQFSEDDGTRHPYIALNHSHLRSNVDQ